MVSKIAFRFSKKSPIQSMIIFLTISVGVGVVFFILCLGTILKSMILDQSTSYQEHLIIQNKRELNYSEITMDLINDLERDNSDIELSLYTSTINGMLVSENGHSGPFSMMLAKGKNPNDYIKYYGLDVSKHLVEGKVNNPLAYEIMLDDYYAKSSNINVGEYIYFTSAYGQNLKLLVTGTYDLGLFRLNRAKGYFDFDLFDNNQNKNYSTSIVFQVKSPMEVEKTLDNIKKPVLDTLGDVKIYSWKLVNPDAELLNLAQIAVVTTIEIFISIAIFVVVVSMLNYQIQQKYHQLGILKAIGVKDSKIYKIFIYQTFIISIPGIIIGLIGGTIVFTEYGKYMVYPDGSPRFNITFNIFDYFIASLIIIATVLLASVLTIRRLKKKTIIELIKI